MEIVIIWEEVWVSSFLRGHYLRLLLRLYILNSLTPLLVPLIVEWN